jgi:membrane protease YdiL (CAAX protease family)
MSRRLKLYFAATFAISWGAWGVLILLTAVHRTAFAQPLFMTLYLLGGLGPTLGAYIAVLATRDASPLLEFHHRLLRWRLSPLWYVIAIGLPVALVLGSAWAAAVTDPLYAGSLHLRPWYAYALLFFVMILGGGLEELGWRGVALPETQRPPLIAALFVGLVWAIWHLPLFYIPVAGQYGADFAIFAIGVMGNALLLAWLYGRTESILLCVFLHASFNAVLALGFASSPRSGLPLLLGACASLMVGGTLLTLFPAPKTL